jgi:cytoskeletal protein RodZ
MGITHHIHELRKKPHHQKKRIALVYSGVATGAIFIVWLSVLLPRNIQHNLAVKPAGSNGAASSLSQIGSQAQQDYSAAQATLNAAASQFNGSGQTAAAGNAAISGSAASDSSAHSAAPAGAPGNEPDASSSASDTPQKTYDFGY